MPLPIAHGLLGASVVAAIHPKPTKRYALPLIFGAFLALVADFDFGFSVFFGLKGWHRGFTHSISFGLLFTLAPVILLGRKYRREAVAYGLAYTSHCILDFATTLKGGGVELLFPFTAQRFGLRWFGLSEIPSRLSLTEIFGALGLEMLIFAPILALILWRRGFFGAQRSRETL